MTMGEKNHCKHDSDRIQRNDDIEIAKLVAEKLEIYLNFERRENYFDTNGTLRVTPRMYGTDRAYASLERKEFDKKTRKQQREDRKNKLKSDEPYISPRLDPDALVTSREAQYLIDAANEIYIKTPVNKLQVIHRYRPTSNRKNIAANGKVHNFVKHVGAVLKSDDYCKYYVDRRLCGHWCLSAQTDNENSPRNCESKTDDEQEKMGKDELEIDSGRPSGGESKDTVVKKTSQDNGDNCDREGDKEMTKKPDDIRTSESSNSGGNDAKKEESKKRNDSLSSKSQSRSRSRSRSRSSSDSRSRSSRSNSRDDKGKRTNDSEYVEGENDKSTRTEHRGQLLKVIIRNTKPRRKSSKKKKTENFRECNPAMMSEDERVTAGKRMNSGSDGKRRTVAEPRYLSYTTGRDRTPVRASSAASPKSSRSPRHQTLHQSRASGGISAWRDPTGRPRSSADEEYHKYSPYSQSVISVKKSLHRQF